jgi:hypothetical protein
MTVSPQLQSQLGFPGAGSGLDMENAGRRPDARPPIRQAITRAAHGALQPIAYHVQGRRDSELVEQQPGQCCRLNRLRTVLIHSRTVVTISA